MPRHPEAVIVPNTLLSDARKRLASPHRPGRQLSRADLADAVNDALGRLYPGRGVSAQYVDFRWIGKLERGEHRWPSEERRAALRHVLGAATDSELGLYSPRRTDSVPSPTPVNARLERPRDTGQELDVKLQTGVRSAIAATAAGSAEAADMDTLICEESAAHGRRTSATNVSDSHIDGIEAALDSICVDTLSGPPTASVPEIRQLRDEAFTVLEGRQYPRQSRRLYAAAARACGLLAATSADRLAQYHVAVVHARTASIAAELAEDPALMAWTASLRSTIAYWQGRFWSAATIAHQARRGDLSGVEVARLAALEARAWARAGDHHAMLAALTAAEAARQEDGPQAGPGLLAFPYANQIRITAAALLCAGEPARALCGLTTAVEMFGSEPPAPAHLAAARADLALAFLAVGSLDDAAAAFQPLLVTTATHLAGAVRRTTLIAQRLHEPRFHGSSTAYKFATNVETFLNRQRRCFDSSSAPDGTSTDGPVVDVPVITR